MPRRVGQEFVEALVHHQQRPAPGTAGQNLLQKGFGGDAAGGVVGLAEKDHVDAGAHRVQQLLPRHKAGIFPQGQVLHRTARQGQSLFILGKGGGSDESPPGPPGQHQAEDQVRRPRPADDLPCIHRMIGSQGIPQFPAEGIGVAPGVGQGVGGGTAHSIRHTQGADVGRKIQRHAAVFPAKALPVSSVGQLHGGLLSMYEFLQSYRIRARMPSRAPQKSTRASTLPA